MNDWATAHYFLYKQTKLPTQVAAFRIPELDYLAKLRCSKRIMMFLQAIFIFVGISGYV